MKNNSIIKSSTFCLQQNKLTELTPKAPFDASSGILQNLSQHQITTKKYYVAHNLGHKIVSTIGGGHM